MLENIAKVVLKLCTILSKLLRVVRILSFLALITVIFFAGRYVLDCEPTMRSSIIVVCLIAVVMAIYVLLREKPFSMSFELNEVYHNPPAGVETIISPYRDLKLSVRGIRNVMQLATIYARPDYVLARNNKKYEQIMQTSREV